MDIRFSPTTTEDGLLVTAVIRDITDSKRVAKALEESEERFRRLSEVTLEGVVIHEHGIILDANGAIAEMLGYRVDEMIGRSVLEFLSPQSHAPAIQSGTTLPQNPRLYVGVKRDGTTFPAEILVREYAFFGRPVRVASVRDVTDRIAAEKALRENEARFRALIENASDFIIVLDRDTTIRFASPSFARMMGYDDRGLVGHKGFEFVHPEDIRGLTETFERRLVEHGVGVPVEFRILRSDGKSRTLEVIANFDLVDSPALSGVILNARDITDRRQAEDAIKQLAYHDALTGLPNRALLEDRLRTAIAQRARDKQMLGIVFLDLDHFKLVNDNLGHVGGDELLKLVGQDLQNLVREGDTVARIGVDEFILLLPSLLRPQEALDVAERILQTFSKRRVILGRELRITTSIGISVYPEDGEDSDSLLANADIAMYQAKENGRNACRLYSPTMKQDVVLRLALENDLRNAFERNEFVMHCQPIVDVRTGDVVAAEALIRWQHPVRGIVPPVDFIPFAAESGLIVDLDEWMLNRACAQVKVWNDAGYDDLRMAVNVSARTLQREDLVDRITRVLSTTGVAAKNLVLEITEGSAMSNFEPIVISLNRLRDLGVTVSVDDFGTGYSSLSYLKQFPIDSVKIDRSFVRDLTIDSNDAAIVSAIISMAHSLSLRVIAEGVEEPEQLAFLKANGCDEFQGYLFAKPLTVADFVQMLASQRERSVHGVGSGSSITP